MSHPPESKLNVAVVGLGYVGLPLALAFATRYEVTGFDIDAKRISELSRGHDRTGEILPAELGQSTITFASDIHEAKTATIFIVAVPTPIDENQKPDLTALETASHQVGAILKPGDLVVFESTVFPGVTEDFCGPILEAVSGLKSGQQFFLGYSPERINPGDKRHAIEKVTKVVAGQNADVTNQLSSLYGAVIPAGVFVAQDIRTAEAAKVIENAQRDINIAFINEVSMIFHRMGIDTESVLAAARTKWNFIDFRPGLVGGHCIGIDPYYLAHAAEQADLNPEIILAGRRINDGMAGYVAMQVNTLIEPASKILVLGLTFKENVADLRNSQVFDLVRALTGHGHDVRIFDPMVSVGDLSNDYEELLLTSPEIAAPYHVIIGAVAHDQFCDMSEDDVVNLLSPQGLLADLKGIWPTLGTEAAYRIWRL